MLRIHGRNFLSQIEDMNSQAQLSAAQQLSPGGAGVPQTLEESGAGGADDDDDDEPPELEAAEEDGALDETGVDPKDIDLVMQQVNCSRAKAVRVLKESGGDLINASTSHFLFPMHVFKSSALQLWQRASRFLFSSYSFSCSISSLSETIPDIKPEGSSL